MGKNCLFESCEKKPNKLIGHFQKIFNGIPDEDQENNVYSQIGDYTYHVPNLIIEINDVTRLIRSRWFCVQEVVLNTSVPSLDIVISSREFLNQAFQNIIQCLIMCIDPALKHKFMVDTLRDLKVLLPSVLSLSKLKDDVVSKMVTSNNPLCPFFHYFHSLLELYYYMVVIFYLCGLTVENMEEQLKSVINSLTVASRRKLTANKSNINICTCTKFCWLTIQLISEKVDVTGSLFWKTFNGALQNEQPLFALSFLKEISLLQCYNDQYETEGSKCMRISSNFKLLQDKLKELFQEADCDTLTSGLKLIEPLLCELWLKDGKIEVYQLLWDFYSKRLNVSNNTSCNMSSNQLSINLDTIIDNHKNCKEDFDLFVGLLLFHLREYPAQWGKIKGRIYCQLGPNKMKELTEIGIKHVFCLYMALSRINFEEMEKKILMFLENIPQERKYTSLVWNLYGAMILKYTKDGHSIEKIAPPILNMLNEASGNQKMFHLLKEFINTLKNVIYGENMRLHQWLLVGPWLGKYLSRCYFADLKSALDVIRLLLDYCRDADSWFYWKDTFKDNVYPTLKHLSVSPTAPPVTGTIAGYLALLCTELTNEIFECFTGEAVYSKISALFLEEILNNYPNNFIITPKQEHLIVQSWMKICLLNTEPQTDLSRNVMKLDIFPVNLKYYVKESPDPLYAFIDYLGNNSKDLQAQGGLIKLCDTAFGNLDKALARYISNPEHEEVVRRFYKYVALAFLNCGNLLYNRNKSVTPLTKLVQALLMPIDFLVGKKSPHNFVINAVKNSWHTYFQAFISLNVSSDPYLERTLKDMIVKYMPYFSTIDSPIATSLENPTVGTVILEKICSAYFKHPVREADAYILKALKIVSDFVQSTTSLDLMTILINKTLLGLFEVVIFHSQRSVAIGVIKTIISSPLFPQITLEFKGAVLNVTEKHMGLNTINYFQLMICLAKFVPELIKEMLEKIKSQVANVERLRGVGYDKSLRLHLEKLENALQS